MLLKQMPVVVALMFGLSLSAHAAETLDSALKKVDRLRAAFGDQYVSALTNLPPEQYKATRDHALKEADKVGDNEFARDDARKALCSKLGDAGPNCENAKSGDDLVSADEEPAPAVSAVEKSTTHGGEDDHVESAAPDSNVDPAVAQALSSSSDESSQAPSRELSSIPQSESDPEL